MLAYFTYHVLVRTVSTIQFSREIFFTLPFHSFHGQVREQPTYHLVRARVLKKQGQYQEAINTLKACLNIANTRPTSEYLSDITALIFVTQSYTMSTGFMFCFMKLRVINDYYIYSSMFMTESVYLTLKNINAKTNHYGSHQRKSKQS